MIKPINDPLIIHHLINHDLSVIHNVSILKQRNRKVKEISITLQSLVQ